MLINTEWAGLYPSREPDWTASWYEDPPSLGSGKSLMRSSMRKMVMAASVANFRLLVLTIVGSYTPACLLSLGFPFTRSKPILRAHTHTVLFSFHIAEVSSKRVTNADSSPKSVLVQTRTKIKHTQFTVTFWHLLKMLLARSCICKTLFEIMNHI